MFHRSKSMALQLVSLNHSSGVVNFLGGSYEGSDSPFAIASGCIWKTNSPTTISEYDFTSTLWTVISNTVPSLREFIFQDCLFRGSVTFSGGGPLAPQGTVTLTHVRFGQFEEVCRVTLTKVSCEATHLSVTDSNVAGDGDSQIALSESPNDERVSLSVINSTIHVRVSHTAVTRTVPQIIQMEGGTISMPRFGNANVLLQNTGVSFVGMFGAVATPDSRIGAVENMGVDSRLVVRGPLEIGRLKDGSVAFALSAVLTEIPAIEDCYIAIGAAITPQGFEPTEYAGATPIPILSQGVLTCEVPDVYALGEIAIGVLILNFGSPGAIAYIYDLNNRSEISTVNPATSSFGSAGGDDSTGQMALVADGRHRLFFAKEGNFGSNSPLCTTFYDFQVLNGEIVVASVPEESPVAPTTQPQRIDPSTEAAMIALAAAAAVAFFAVIVI